ncbi:hypothetical protein [Mesohalobacter halotolerans]|uniref:Outer membrane protein beta-barrel domain-containing protein n=1 Tax=Mesohalobacter halotolerans TaxID=1883405 RepID=A0A4U5TTT4_9FLAO|nr:hypothetical protein [Mesohalobacter halotolerans]TKS57563.1 hypothetical protein FCN74_03865 [Mesohalobacter halotolerans]
MKKLILVIGIALVGFSVNAQNFNVGVSGGIPTGDNSDFYSFGIILDANYLYDVSEEFSVGATTGFIYSLLDSDFEGDDAGFLPIAAAARYSISEEFVLGADLGYALGVTPSELDGGFYYAPKLQYYFTETISGVVSYRGISVDSDAGGSASFDHITFGVEFKL